MRVVFMSIPYTTRNDPRYHAPSARAFVRPVPPSPSLSGAGWEERARTRGYSEAQAKALNDADAGSVLTTETSGRWRWGARRGGYLTATAELGDLGRGWRPVEGGLLHATISMVSCRGASATATGFM